MTERTTVQDFGEQHPSTEDHPRVTHYSVNGEAQETTKQKLTVREILSNAGFTPPDDYELTRDEGNKTFFDLDEEIPVHEGEAFTATFTGPTPTS